MMDVHFHIVEILLLAWLIRLAHKILRKEKFNMATLDELVAAAQAEDTKIDSLIALVEALKAKIDAIPGITPEQQAKIDESFAAISDNPDRIQAALDANTPAEG